MTSYIDILKKRIIQDATPRLKKVKCPSCKMLSTIHWDTTFEGIIFLDPSTPCIKCLNCGFRRWIILDKEYRIESKKLKEEIRLKRNELEKSSRFKITIRKA